MQNKGINDKRVLSVEAAIKAVELKSGMTISFHHHYRHGDKTVALVMAAIKKLKIKNLKISASCFTKAHDCLIDYIKDGTVSELEGTGIIGKLGAYVSTGVLKNPVLMRSHGARPKAIMNHEIKIDVAFIAAASSDCLGNANGVVGPNAFGSIGYAVADAIYAKKTIVLTDTIVPFPNVPAPISCTNVDYVVVVNQVGDPMGIAAGEIHVNFTPKERLIAKNIVLVMQASGLLKTGFSFQTGTGGASQSSLLSLTQIMAEQKIQASFFLGGIIGPQTKLLMEGFVQTLLDVQSFDQTAIKSLLNNPHHVEISADYYANPYNKFCAVNALDFGILSALEVDVNFNANVVTGSDGRIQAPVGGHQDVAAGAKIAIVAIPLFRGRIPSIVERVTTICTPGKTIDVIVTEIGVAVNPQRSDLIKKLKQANVELYDIKTLNKLAYQIVGKPKPIDFNKTKTVAIIQDRNGQTLDRVYQLKNFTQE